MQLPGQTAQGVNVCLGANRWPQNSRPDVSWTARPGEVGHTECVVYTSGTIGRIARAFGTRSWLDLPYRLPLLAESSLEGHAGELVRSDGTNGHSTCAERCIDA